MLSPSLAAPPKFTARRRDGHSEEPSTNHPVGLRPRAARVSGRGADPTEPEVILDVKEPRRYRRSMPDPAATVLFLGAGASLSLPAGGPLFAEVRDACAERMGVCTRDWPDQDPRRELLDHVIPEVFLKVVTDAGYRLEQALADAVSGGVGPNAVHRLAARVLQGGGTVWTTNWDGWIERAYLELVGEALRPAVPGTGPPPPKPPFYGKLHGTADDPGRLLFRTPQVMRPLPSVWHRAVVESCRGRLLFVAGYGGADVDLFPALDAAMDVARAAYWFEGAGSAALLGHRLAGYETWRFRLTANADPAALPPAGRHLVWCGAGSSASDPSRGLLDAFGDPTPAGAVPSPGDRYDAVSRRVRALRPQATSRGRRLLTEAIVRERLADRRGAGARHLAVVIVGSRGDKLKALGALRNLGLLRARRLRTVASRVYAIVEPSRERADFIRQHAGEIRHDAALAERIASGKQSATIDAALNAAVSTRWSGDLRIAERLARAQLDRALTQDLDSAKRDWPERVSRAAFELAQSLVWQDRYYDADDVCRTAHMRLSGAKWTAWEFAMSATVRFAYGDYHEAEAQFARAETILRLEGFDDYTVTLSTGRSASLRLLGDLERAGEHLRTAERRPRKGPGSVAAVLAERAEMCLSAGDAKGTRAAWATLTGSQFPLWRGIAHLRLAETQSSRPDAEQALRDFGQAGSAWGMIRSDAALEDTPRSAIDRAATDLGPSDVFVPGGPWLM